MGNSNNLNSRLDRQKKRKGDRLLNILIATVVIAIVIVAFIVIPGGKEEAGEERNQNQGEEIVQEDEKEQDDLEDPADVQEAEQEELEIDEPEEEQENEELVITEEPNDPVVAQSIVDPAWAPIQTAQVGDHVSMYDGTSIDWQEKIAALSYATGLPEEGMTIWRLKNGGSPQKSIGIVSSKDKAEKYRVYLDWIDGEGWKPVKMDVLNTLEFDY